MLVHFVAAVVAISFVSSAALHIKDRPMPQCIMAGHTPKWSNPPLAAAPKSWGEAASQSVSTVGECYATDTDNLVNAGKCCCGFWGAPQFIPPPPTRFRCLGSYPSLTHQDTVAECADIAVAVSGSLQDDVASFFNNIQDQLVRPAAHANLSVHVFAHLGLGSSVGRLPVVPSFVKGIIVEPKADDRITRDIMSCTEGMFDTVFDTIGKRFQAYGGLRDHAGNSSQYLYRHMYLAHHMVFETEQKRKCNYKYVMRYRPDFGGGSVNWIDLLERLKEGKLLIGADRWLYHKRSLGSEHSHRCVFDDQLAIGTPWQMYQYASVYEDFADFAKYLPLYRSDFRGHTSERILTTHLHYRGLGDKVKDFPHDLKANILKTFGIDS